MTPSQPEVARPVLAVLAILGLILASFWIMRPFLGAIVWATTIVVATWPALLALERRLWGKRGLAVTVLSIVLLGALFVPFVLSVGAIVNNVDAIVAKTQSLSGLQLPALPAWVTGLPLVGGPLSRAWDQVVAAGGQDLLAQAAPYAGKIVEWAVARIGGIGLALAQFLLTVVIAAILWTNGESAAAIVRRYAVRLAGERGDATLRLAGQAIRGVALGVVVTALVQALLAGLGLLLVGVPFVPVLTAATFVLCIAQLGPFLVLVPVVIWLFGTGSTGWGVFLLVWTIVVGLLDNVLRPVLIKKGADLPLLLVFAGVLGGLMSLGLIGIFVGPVVLAVTHTLGEAWARAEPRPE